MRDWPLAFHMTFGTYGTRLHGDERSTVARPLNHFGQPFVEPDEIRQQFVFDSMIGNPLYLSAVQRIEIERIAPEICQRGGWDFHIAAAQPDHVHCLLSCRSEPKVARKLLKRWLSDHLTANWALNHSPRWWADGGSGKYVWDEDYFRRAFEYIERQRATPWNHKSEPGCLSPVNSHTAKFTGIPRDSNDCPLHRPETGRL